MVQEEKQTLDCLKAPSAMLSVLVYSRRWYLRSSPERRSCAQSPSLSVPLRVGLTVFTVKSQTLPPMPVPSQFMPPLPSHSMTLLMAQDSSD